MSITNTSLTMTNWFSGMTKTVTRCKQLFSLFAVIGGSVAELFMKAMDRVLFAAFTCILALGGSIVGSIAGGIKGQTTEAGFLDGAGKGAITGAIASLELINFASLDEPLSKISTLETIFEEVSDIYDIRGLRGIPQNVIMKLPFQPFNSNKMLKSYNTSCCSICYQDFEDGELVRILPKCSHHFHLECIDKWLVQQGSCPMCRTYVPDHIRN
ncbi:NEP1-interacting protein 1 isoform X2 [Cajanus cajan]|uniref:NEP1-interacting protein 1 isoform X2 n=1 Tax=Cajanus cajan TaxID=3821 RepID=UPI00098DCD2E|nr:NEP1-interacting protein 1 isoform X2 [Cajanus cajan]